MLTPNRDVDSDYDDYDYYDDYEEDYDEYNDDEYDEEDYNEAFDDLPSDVHYGDDGNLYDGWLPIPE